MKTQKPPAVRHLGGIIRPRGRSFSAEVNCAYARHRKTLKTVDDARRWIERTQVQILNVTTPLSTEELVDVTATIRRLPAGVTLKDLIAFWQQHHNSTTSDLTVEAFLGQYLQEKTRAGRRPDTLSDIRHRVGKFAKDFGGRMVSEIGTGDLVSWLDKWGYAGVTRDNFRRVLHAFFGYAVDLSVISLNPVRGVKRLTLDESLPGIWSVDRVQTLLTAAEGTAPALVPWLAIGFFAGLRTVELEGLRWPDVDLAARLLTVRPETAKRRRQRHVTIVDNLVPWLAPHVQAAGPVAPTEGVRRGLLDEVLKAANVGGWIANGMRHSFGSYHCARWQDAPRTAFEMGHSAPDMLFNHYRNLVTRAEAERYWEIRPTAGKVIQLPRVSA